MSQFTHWNYRVLKETLTTGGVSEDDCRIIECYYDKDDRIVAWGEAQPSGETVAELCEDLNRMVHRCGLAMLSKADKRVLTLADLPPAKDET